MRTAATARVLPVLAAAAALALAGCATGPEKTAAGSGPAPDARSGQSSPGKRSPYAPAQEDLSKRGNYTAGGLYAPHIKDSVPDHLPDVDAIPEPEVVAEPRSRYGNRSPYKVLGKTYHVLDSAEGYDETGLASYYGNKFHGRRTSNLEVYDMYAFTAAHKSLPLPSFARVTNLDNGKSVVVRVNDRGPFHDGRIIDLSYAAAVKIGIRDRGTGRVEVVGLSPGENARNDRDPVAAGDSAPSAPAVAAGTAGNGALQLPPGVRIATGKPQPATPSAMDELIEGGLAGDAPVGDGAPAVAAAATIPPSSSHAAAAVPAGTDWRFDMRQDGKAMTADEFDAWMRARRARVATGKPVLSGAEGAGKPDPYGSAAPGAPASAPVDVPAPAPETLAAARDADDGVVVPVPPPVASGVTLQVAAFGARANAERALSMLRGAGVPGARLLDAVSAGKQVWRVRVGPVDSAKIPELSARVAGLGFGQPQVVRD